MATKHKKKETVRSVHLTHKARLTPEAARKEFLKTVPKKEDTEIDDTLQKFMYAIDFIVHGSGQGSFTERDVLIALKQFDLEDRTAEVQRLFKLWADKMESLGIVSVVEGVYDGKVYLLH